MTAPHLEPGQVVAGRYTIRSLLGFSGAVATYHAITTQYVDVVLKLLDPAIGQRADLMSALETVNQAAAALPPESVVNINDAGYDQSTGAPFMATEMLTTSSLARLVEGAPVSDDVLVKILSGLAIALDAAHARSLFHHSIKPTNIFVGPAPAYAVRVTDFAASVIRGAVPTNEAYVLCAPWWAPEQMQSRAQLGAQTDVYAAGLVAFHALTGRSYWKSCQYSPPDVKSWQHEVLVPPPAASSRAGELGCPLNAALDPIFARALAVDPAGRYRSVGELADTLASVVTRAVSGRSQGGTIALPIYQVTGAQPSTPQAEPSPPAAGYPVAPAVPAAGYPAVPAVPAAGYPAAPAVPAMVASSAESAAPAGETPGLPPFPEPAPQRPKTNVLPIALGIGAAILIAGVAAGVLVYLRPSPESGELGTGTAEPSASGQAGTTQPAGTATDSTAATPPDGPDAGDADDAGTEVADREKKVAVTLRCTPPCDRIMVDNEELKAADEQLELLPGRHTVQLFKTGYVPHRETITVDPDQPYDKEFVLVPIPTGGKKKCGKFLERCD